MIKYVYDEYERAKIIARVLADLPFWFGIPEATEKYIEEGKKMIMIARYINDEAIGFISLNPHNEDTIEIYVMGIMANYHRQGYGKELMNEAVKYAKINSYKLIEVKTLDSSYTPYNFEYDVTRQYYQKMGFVRLECLKEIWGDSCPCLIMVRII